MEIHARYVWVGLITFTMILFTIWYILWISVRQNGDSKAIYDIYFSQNIAGLQIGSSVLLRGVQVGRVSDIQFVQDHSSRVRVQITVSDSAPIRQDSVATIEPQGITGLANIQISAGSPQSPYLRPIDDGSIPIIIAGTSRFEEILSAVPNILVTTTNILNKINDTLSPTTLTDFKNIVSDASAVLKNLVQQKNNINTFFSSTASAFESFEVTNHKLQTYLDTQISPITAKLASIIDDIPGIIASINEKLADITPIVTDAQKTILQTKIFFMNLNSTLQHFQDNPKKFFFGKTLPDFKE